MIQDVGPDDERLAWYRGVADPALLREGQRFVAEGRVVVERLVRDRRWHVESVLVSPPACRALEPLFDTRPELPVFVMPADDLTRLAGHNIHRGCLAIGRLARRPLVEWRLAANPDALGRELRSRLGRGTPDP